MKARNREKLTDDLNSSLGHLFHRGRAKVEGVEVFPARRGNHMRAAGRKCGLRDGKVVQVDALDLGVAHPIHLHPFPTLNFSDWTKPTTMLSVQAFS